MVTEVPKNQFSSLNWALRCNKMGKIHNSTVRNVKRSTAHGQGSFSLPICTTLMQKQNKWSSANQRP